MSFRNSACARANPPDHAEIFLSRHGDLFIENDFVGVIAKHYLDFIIFNFNHFHVLAYNIVLIGYAGFDVVIRPVAVIEEVFYKRHSGAAGKDDALRNLGADRVILVGGNRHRGQDSNNSYDDHEFDQCEALLFLFHLSSLESAAYFFRPREISQR